MTNQASEDDDFRCWDCKSENLPYCVECSPYLQGGEKGTDTNQASEVKRNSLNKSDIDVKLVRIESDE